jgi:hypothetical protein
MKKVTAFKTSDGRFFESQEEAESYEKELRNVEVLKLKERYVRERLKESSYGYLFVNEYASRKHFNIGPDSPLVNTLIVDSNLLKEIIAHLETIK